MNQDTSLLCSSNFTIVYDNNWNIINNGKYIFQYDYKNRIRSVKCGVNNETCTEGETIVNYKYDILWRRNQKETPTKTINYIYSNNDIIQEIIIENGTTTKKNYINGLWVDELEICVKKQLFKN